MGCLVVVAAIAADIFPTQIVDEKEDNIKLAWAGPLARGGIREGEKQRQGEDETGVHV